MDGLRKGNGHVEEALTLVQEVQIVVGAVYLSLDIFDQYT